MFDYMTRVTNYIASFYLDNYSSPAAGKDEDIVLHQDGIYWFAIPNECISSISESAKRFVEQSDMSIIFNSGNEKAELFWRMEKLDRLKSKDVYLKTFSMCQVISNIWISLQRMCVTTLMMNIEHLIENIQEEREKFLAARNTALLVETRKMVEWKRLFIEFSEMYPKFIKSNSCLSTLMAADKKTKVVEAVKKKVEPKKKG